MSSLVVSVLRSPTRLVDALSEPAALAREAPRLLLLVGGGAAAFGAAVGLQRDALQLVYAALKLPAVLLVPLLVALPAVRALAATFGPAAHPARAAAAGLVGMARTAILAAAAAPAAWLLMSTVLGYSASVLLLAGTLAACGLPGLRVLAEGVSDLGLPRMVASFGAVVLYGAVAAQTGWLLRPFVLRPDAPVVFLREARGDVFAVLAQHAGEPDAGAPVAPPAVAPVHPITGDERERLAMWGYMEPGPATPVEAAPPSPDERPLPAEIERLRALSYLE